MKRSADNSAGPAHNADTRLRKLKTDNSGRPILPVDKKKEKAEDKAKDAVAEMLEGLAVTLENDPNGQGRELWNNPGVGHALQHLVKAVEARADKCHVRDDIDVARVGPALGEPLDPKSGHSPFRRPCFQRGIKKTGMRSTQFVANARTDETIDRRWKSVLSTTFWKHRQ